MNIYHDCLWENLQKKINIPILGMEKRGGYWWVKIFCGWKCASALLGGHCPPEKTHYVEIKQ